MTKAFAIEYTLENILACNLKGKHERDIRELVYVFWEEAERKQQCFISLDTETYYSILDEIYKEV